MDLQLEAYEGLGLTQPVDWSRSEREGQWEEPACSAQQDSLLADDTVSGYSLGLSSSPTTSQGSDHFPCIADELEEQAKQLEEDWFCPSQPPAAAAALAKGQQAFRLSGAAHIAAPALRHSGLDRLQRQLVQLEQQQRRRQEQQPADGQAELERPASRSGAAGGGEEPSTPQRQSKDSSWNESPPPRCSGGDGSSRGGGGGMDYGEVQSPAPAKLVSLSPPAAAAADRRPPLALAIDNAQRVRLGQEPAAPCAWRGCASGAWCTQEARHCGPCNGDATVPSLLAYPAEELFESGVNLEELCHLPQQLADAAASPLAPDTDSEGCGAAAADCLSSGKRRADTEADAEAEAEADDGASHSQSGQLASSGSPAAAAAAAGEEEHHSGGSSHAAKRLRSIAVPSIPALAPAAAELAQLTRSAGDLPAGGGSGSRGLQAADGFVPVCAGMVPVAAPQFAPPVPPLACSAASRNLGRPAGAPRLRPIARTAAPEPAAAPTAAAAGPAATITPNKPVTRQQPRTPDSAGATVAPRPSGRKAVLQWHTESVTDPRTGATVTSVQPATFCTQCFALSTPVWRAGPFGVKSLCNACGVRWMKASKSSKK